MPWVRFIALKLCSGISILVVISKRLLMMCNSYLVQFLKTHISLTMSTISLFCQNGQTCLFHCSCCLFIGFGILINTYKYIEIIFFLIFSKSLPCLQLRQRETILGSDCPHVRNI